jgi:hypothetical protein
MRYLKDTLVATLGGSLSSTKEVDSLRPCRRFHFHRRAHLLCAASSSFQPTFSNRYSSRAHTQGVCIKHRTRGFAKACDFPSIGFGVLAVGAYLERDYALRTPSCCWLSLARVLDGAPAGVDAAQSRIGLTPMSAGSIFPNSCIGERVVGQVFLLGLQFCHLRSHRFRLALVSHLIP